MTIRELKSSELGLLYHYSSLENWQLEKIETEALFATHPQDFFIAFEGEVLIGFIVAIRHTQVFGFISSFLVLKEFRSQGLGTQIFKHALQHLKDTQIALDSVPKHEEFYKKFGFLSYFDVLVYTRPAQCSNANFVNLDVFTMKNSICLDDKTEYQKKLFANSSLKCQSIIQNDKESSYAYIFPYADAYKIEIHASNINEVLALYFALTKGIAPDAMIYIKVDALSPVLLSIRKILNMKLHNKYTRMYNKIV